MATQTLVLKPKRHKEWAAFTVTLCTPCLQKHVWKYLVRYPVLKTHEEKCQCPCGHEHAEKAA